MRLDAFCRAVRRAAFGVTSGLLLVLLALAGTESAHAIAASGSGIYHYDAPALARVGGHASAHSEAGHSSLSISREGSASRAVEARGTSTTPLARKIATEAEAQGVGDFEFRVEYRTDVYAEQRGLENELYDRYLEAMSENGGFNKIRAISPGKTNRPGYVQAANDYLSRLGSK
jgi:hypothetical protein